MHTLHANFNGGELSPLLDARVDTSAYQSGCRQLENFVVRPYGGAFKRPGTQYGGAVKTAAKKTRLIAFKRSTSTNYIVEVGDQYIRFWTGGSSMTLVESSPGTPYEVASPYLEADLFQIQVCQINDVMFLAHPSYAPRKLSYTSATSWALAVISWDFAPMGDVNETSTTVTAQPNVANWATSTSYAAGAVVLRAGILYTSKSAHTSGASTQPGVGGSWTGQWAVTRCRGPWEGDSTASPKANEVGEVVNYNGLLYSCISTTNQTPSTTPSASPGVWYPFTVGSGVKLFSSANAFTASDVGATWRLDIGGAQRGVFLTVYSVAYTSTYSQPLFIQGDVLIRSNFVTPNAAAVGELQLQESQDGVTFNNVRSWTWRKTQDGNINTTYQGSTTGAWYRLTWYPYAGTTVNEGFFMESVNSILNNVVTIDTVVSATEATGHFANNPYYVPCEIMARPTTLWHRPAFYGGAYPRAVAFHDSRLFWGGVTGQPSRIWGSRLDDYYNYLTGADDDSALDLTLAATEANQIEWLISYSRSLICGTTGDEWTIDSGENDAALTPTSMRARLRTRHGSLSIAPQFVADALLWVARGGRRIHELSYDFASDRYQAPDMTQLAEHLTAGGIVQTAFSANPDSVLWAVTGDGLLIGFTYDRAQQITAWHRHRTGERVSGGSTVYDSFESVSTIYGANGRDEVWFVVKRTVNGSTVRYIERFYPTAQDFNFDTATDLFYVDCGKKVTPSGASVTGLTHIEGRAVSAWSTSAGGVNRIDSLTVSAGAVTLGASAASAIVGLPFTSVVQTMKQEIVLQDGTAQGRRWKPNRAVFRLYQSYGGKYCSTSSGTFEDINYREPYQFEAATTPAVALRTTDLKGHVSADWTGSIDFTVKHDSPTPFNLLGYVLVGEVAGS